MQESDSDFELPRSDVCKSLGKADEVLKMLRVVSLK